MAKKKGNTVSAPAMTGMDKKWQAESDARTLAEAQVILKDSKRLKAAAGAATKMADDKMIEAKAMKRIARKG